MARLVHLRESEDPALKVCEASQRAFAQGRQNVVSEDERNGLFIVLVGTWGKEAGVREDSFFCLLES